MKGMSVASEKEDSSCDLGQRTLDFSEKSSNSPPLA